MCALVPFRRSLCSFGPNKNTSFVKYALDKFSCLETGCFTKVTIMGTAFQDLPICMYLGKRVCISKMGFVFGSIGWYTPCMEARLHKVLYSGVPGVRFQRSEETGIHSSLVPSRNVGSGDATKV